ncbi:MAG: hypothetical protein CTY36_10640 [Methylocystis sp.]|nr:MAG: hypothetical protein CTY36_10640 [Methylocystis sp.]
MSSYNGCGVTLADRIEHGLLTIQELCALKLVSISKVYEDIAAGNLPVEKHGRLTRVQGPIAKRYVPGQRCAAEGAAAGEKLPDLAAPVGVRGVDKPEAA